MSESKVPANPLFVSTRYPYYSAVVDPGGEMIEKGRVKRTKPRFAEFRPGPMGGHFEVTDKAAKKLHMTVDELLESLRERDSIDKEFLEVKDISQIPGLVKAREDYVRDAEDQDKKSGKTRSAASKASAVEAAPEVKEPPVPSAPKAPVVGRKKKDLAPA